MARKEKIAFLPRSILGGKWKWKVMEHIRWMVMLLVWLALWGIRSFVAKFPSYGVIASTDPSPQADTSVSVSGCGIGRALCQVLAVMNDTPVNSRKYEFIRSLAERMIEENGEYGCAALEEVNRMALSAGFARTVELLSASLEGGGGGRGRGRGSWTLRLIRMFYLRGTTLCWHLMRRVENAIGIGGCWRPPPPARPQASGTDSALAEKLAKELMWIAEKLAMCWAADEAILHWSSATWLANLSVSAHPGVQASLVRVSALLLKELARASEEEGPGRLKMLLLWLPLFTSAMNGVDSPVLSSTERAEMERLLENAIQKLSEVDQELVLSNWLRQYTVSSSDWPNLGKCYNRWCQASRKLL